MLPGVDVGWRRNQVAARVGVARHQRNFGVWSLRLLEPEKQPGPERLDTTSRSILWNTAKGQGTCGEARVLDEIPASFPIHLGPEFIHTPVTYLRSS
jgi:hypothetical protein